MMENWAVCMGEKSYGLFFNILAGFCQWIGGKFLKLGGCPVFSPGVELPRKGQVYFAGAQGQGEMSAVVSRG